MHETEDLLSYVDFHVINQPNLAEPGSNAEHGRTLDLFNCLQALLVNNLQTNDILIRTLLIKLLKSIRRAPNVNFDYTIQLFEHLY